MDGWTGLCMICVFIIVLCNYVWLWENKMSRMLMFHHYFFHRCSSRGIFWPPILVSPASILTGRAWLTRWRTVKMSTRPQTPVECFLPAVYLESCRPLDICQTTPWTACKQFVSYNGQGALWTTPHIHRGVLTWNMDIISLWHTGWGGRGIVASFVRSLRSVQPELP